MILFSILIHRFPLFRHVDWTCFLVCVHLSTAVLTRNNAAFDREGEMS